MLFRLTVFNCATFGVMLLTLGMIWARYTIDPERTWLLFYYAPVATYTMAYWDSLHPPWVLVGVVSALVLRFEFMGDWVAKTVRAVESVFLVYVVWRCGVLLEVWPAWPVI